MYIVVVGTVVSRTRCSPSERWQSLPVVWLWMFTVWSSVKLTSILEMKFRAVSRTGFANKIVHDI